MSLRMQIANQDTETYIYNSIGFCSTQCGNAYTYAILQDALCWCSNTVPSDTVSISECNTSCPGYPSDMCGGPSVYSYIYSGNSSATTPVPLIASASATSSNKATSASASSLASQTVVSSNGTSSTPGHSSGNSTSGSNSTVSGVATKPTGIDTNGAAGLSFNIVGTVLAFGVVAAFAL